MGVPEFRKFGNGAQTGAFQYLFNQVVHGGNSPRDWTEEQWNEWERQDSLDFLYWAAYKPAELAAGYALGAGIWRAGAWAFGAVRGIGQGVLEGANFAQTTFSRTFSASPGRFAGQTIDEVAKALSSGSMKVGDVPIEYIVRNGSTLILNTRSAQALQLAGIPRAQWKAVNMTGTAGAEARLTGQLRKNGLGSRGIANPTPSGGK